ncbi:MAG: hypothetical protein LBP52_04360, partial [Burkholderiaceae bacterium]|nr:hypothetical protein [Burkholderiaceae bacterium]
MSKYNSFKKSALAMAVASLWIAPCSSALADKLDLAQSPPVWQSRLPAPNVILSLDDSGSMSEAAAGGLSKMALLKKSLHEVFGSSSVVKDGDIRLAWQVMDKAPLKNIVPGAINSMKMLDATHRANFIDFVDNYLNDKGGVTATHLMMRQADTYMRTPKGINSPWAAIPGQIEWPYLGCRRAYHIVLTDGEWYDLLPYSLDLSPGVYSRAKHTLPDGKIYDPNDLQTNVFKSGTTKHSPEFDWNDRYLGKVHIAMPLVHISDWALKSWAEDLQPGIGNDIKPDREYLSASDAELFYSGANALQLQKYWNPKYDPATWQHLVTYSIGYGKSAAQGWGSLGLKSPTEKLPYGFDGAIPDLITGSKLWPEIYPNYRTIDMWAASINGRGRFYAVQDPLDLTGAFKSILEKIITANVSGVSTVGASGGSVVNSEAGIFSASYDQAEAWSGAVSAIAYKPDGTMETPAGWMEGGKPVTTADRLDFLTDKEVMENAEGNFFDYSVGQYAYQKGRNIYTSVDQVYLANGSHQMLWVNKFFEFKCTPKPT